MEVITRPPPPAKWISELAEECAFLLDMRDHLTMQARVKREAEAHRLHPMALSKMVAEEWDRQGICRVPSAFPGGPR
jgi:hypothetical protein